MHETHLNIGSIFLYIQIVTGKMINNIHMPHLLMQEVLIINHNRIDAIFEHHLL